VLRFLGLTVAAPILDSSAARVQSQLRHHRFLTTQLEDTAIGSEALSFYARMCVEAGWHEDSPPRPLLGGFKRLNVMQYQALVRRIQDAASQAVPNVGTVMVVSRGDDALLQLNGCRA